MKYLFCITILFLLSLLNSEAQEFKKYDTDSYSIAYPETWTFDTSGQMNTSFIIFSKLEQNDTFRENVNLMIQDLKGLNLDLEGYTELSIKQINAAPNSKIFESKAITKGDMTFHKIVWKGFVSGRNLKFSQLYHVKNEKAFLVTLTCEEKYYNDYIETGTYILNSFILK